MTDQYSIVAVLGSGFAGAALAAVVNIVVGCRDRAARVRGHWGALLAEVKKCGENAGGFLTANPHVLAPSYRLPTLIYENGLPALLADAGIDDAEAKILLDFYAQVEALNRGLDLATDVRNDKGVLYDEDQRNKMKAKSISQPDGSAYVPAHDLCARKRHDAGEYRIVFRGRP